MKRALLVVELILFLIVIWFQYARADSAMLLRYPAPLLVKLFMITITAATVAGATHLIVPDEDNQRYREYVGHLNNALWGSAFGLYAILPTLLLVGVAYWTSDSLGRGRWWTTSTTVIILGACYSLVFAFIRRKKEQQYYLLGNLEPLWFTIGGLWPIVFGLLFLFTE